MGETPKPPPRRLSLAPTDSGYDAAAHFGGRAFVPEHEGLPECDAAIRNIGWTLGNDCPYRCRHCYSMSARRRGADLSIAAIDRVVGELAKNGIETVNLGGNEPLFTNGPRARDTLLPEIIGRLAARGLTTGLTTSGVTAIHLERDHNEAFRLLNDVDVSLDSPFAEEHDENRGARIFHEAIEALRLCQAYGIPHTIVTCGMDWNFDRRHLEALVAVAREHGANVRVNPIKTVEPGHLALALSPERYYEGFSFLMQHCDVIDLGEPPLATMARRPAARGCPCGRTSFRIHSMTPEGAVPVSPCVYLHDFKAGDLLVDNLADIVRSPQFAAFRRRNAGYEHIPGCAGCALGPTCRGGCAARGYLANAHATQGGAPAIGAGSLFHQDPYCPQRYVGRWEFPRDPALLDVSLVHRDYLCTWIGRPRS